MVNIAAAAASSVHGGGVRFQAPIQLVRTRLSTF